MPTSSPPLLTPLPYLDSPVPWMRALSNLPGLACLDSQGHVEGRWDIVTADPLGWWRLQGATYQWSPQARAPSHLLPSAQRFDQLQAVRTITEGLTLWDPCPHPGPFSGGWVGYQSYEAFWPSEHLGNLLTEPCHKLPELAWGLYDWWVVNDHHQRTSTLACQPTVTSATYDNLCALLDRARPTNNQATKSWSVDLAALNADLDAATYRDHVMSVQRDLRHGAYYQTNLAIRWSAPYQGDTLMGYDTMRRCQPGPFGGFLRPPGNCDVLCFSPEHFLTVEDQEVTSSPIKGTAPRYHHDPTKDRASANQLAACAKNRAENLMIVDLMRHEFGPHCCLGSITVPELCALTTYDNVHHLTSVVRGELHPERDLTTLLSAMAPSGSITGAPKLAAMAAINRLEPYRRHAYCGNLGYLNVNGSGTWNVAIRTVLCERQPQRLSCYGGSGLVLGSEWSSEHHECRVKIERLLRASASGSDPN